jgi:hypothetical protein
METLFPDVIRLILANLRGIDYRNALLICKKWYLATNEVIKQQKIADYPLWNNETYMYKKYHLKYMQAPFLEPGNVIYTEISNKDIAELCTVYRVLYVRWDNGSSKLKGVTSYRVADKLTSEIHEIISNFIAKDQPKCVIIERFVLQKDNFFTDEFKELIQSKTARFMFQKSMDSVYDPMLSIMKYVDTVILKFVNHNYAENFYRYLQNSYPKNIRHKIINPFNLSRMILEINTDATVASHIYVVVKLHVDSISMYWCYRQT